MDCFYSAAEHRSRGALWPSFAPARISYVDYAEALAGRIKKRRFIHPIGAYIVERGGTYITNEFIDANLMLGEDHFENIRMLLKSAKKQRHPGVTIRMTPDSSAAILPRMAEISALEFAEVETKSSTEIQGTESLTFTFQER